MNPPDGSLDRLVAERSVIVCSGSGGVGKTTVAAVLAMEAARLGRRAIVVTIDPAKRLADALGLTELANEPTQIDGDWPGSMHAMMLDTKSTFDDMVRRDAGDKEQAENILANRFYRNISGALSGTQEYMAMQKLYELHHETDFDLVVVDTPPTRNALDFIDAPNKLIRFFDHRLYRVLTAPGKGMLKAVNLAAQTFVRTVGRVIGGEVLDDAIGFFRAFEGMDDLFLERARNITELLADDDTVFLLVASPKRDTVEEALYFAEKLKDSEIGVQSLVVNRMHPSFGEGLAEAVAERAATHEGTALGGLYRNLADFRLIAAREEDEIRPLVDAVTPAPVVRVPFLRSDVHDLEGMAAIGDLLFER